MLVQEGGAGSLLSVPLLWVPTLDKPPSDAWLTDSPGSGDKLPDGTLDTPARDLEPVVQEQEQSTLGDLNDTPPRTWDCQWRKTNI